MLSYAGITVALVVAVLGGTRAAVRHDAVAGLLEGRGAGVDAAADRSGRGHAGDDAVTGAAHGPAAARDDAARGVLRVGYLPDALPFAFVNQAGDLVGFDVELAHDLARELGVTLAFVPLDRDSMAAQLDAGYCDLVMSGVAVTTERARDLLLSDSYLDETMALVVPRSSARSVRDLGARFASAAP